MTEAHLGEVAKWIKHQLCKKHEPIIVKPSAYGIQFMAWWHILQPLWCISSPGVFGRDVSANKSWVNLDKGGSSGIYIMVVALSWWINALISNTENSDAWMIVSNVLWVLQQIHNTNRENRNGKHICSSNESGGYEKRLVISILGFVMTFNKCVGTKSVEFLKLTEGKKDHLRGLMVRLKEV